MSDIDTQVSELLARSKAAHQEFIFHSPRMGAVPGQPQPQLHAGDATQARAFLLEACDLRKRAHALDPDHVSPAWANDMLAVGHKTDAAGVVASPHDEILDFYDLELKRLN